MINYYIWKTILIDYLLIITLLSEVKSDSKKISSVGRAQVGICQSYDSNQSLHITNCFRGIHWKEERKYCCSNASLTNWTQLTYCCNIDEFFEEYSFRLLIILALAVISVVIFSIQVFININLFQMIFGINQTNLGNGLQTSKTLTDNQNDNKSEDKIKTNEENKKKKSNNRKNSGNRETDAKPSEK